MKQRALPSLGPRGEGWVAIQSAVLILLAVAGVAGPRWPGGAVCAVRVLGGVLGVLGALVLVAGILALGRRLTPFPKPLAGRSLKQNGIYGGARHPIYGGAMMLAAAWALLTSWAAFFAAVALVVFLDLKSRREEQWLLEHHAEYAAYLRRVRRRFIPWVW